MSVTNHDQSSLTKVFQSNNGLTILAANGKIMPSKACGQLQLSLALTPQAQQTYVLDDLKTGTLISLGKICDDECIALFTKYGIKMIKNHHVIITGKREDNILWTIPLYSVHPQPVRLLQANGIVQLDKTKQNLAAYHHAFLVSPDTSILLSAIWSGHLVSMPGLNTNIISKHLPKSIATALGHQDQ